MNDYTGKICPFCKTEFNPTDEIVMCSECDMPHHKDCWVENQGCTTFGCLGAIKSADNIATSVTSQHMNFEYSPIRNSERPVFCTRCGTQNVATSLACSKCGNLLTIPEPTSQAPVYSKSNQANQDPYAYVNQYNPSYQQQSNYSASGYTSYHNASVDEDIQHLIGVKSEYYVPKFQEMKSRNKQTSWNWAAFLFAPYWLIYRKMYGYGVGFLAATFLLSLIGSTFLSFLSFAGNIAIGIFGNSIYMKSLEGKAMKAKSMNEPFRFQFIARNSGVNSTATIRTVIAYTLYAMLMIIWQYLW